MDLSTLLSKSKYRAQIEANTSLRSLLVNLASEEEIYNQRFKEYDKARKSGSDRLRMPTPKATAKVTKIYKNGEWEYNFSQPLMASEFIKELEKTFDQGVDQFCYQAYKGKTIESQPLIPEMPVILNEQTKDIPIPAAPQVVYVNPPAQSAPPAAPSQEPFQSAALGAVEQGIKELKESLLTIKSTPAVDEKGNTNLQLLELQMKFEKQIDELQHKSEIDRLTHKYEVKIKELEEEIDGYQEEIRYLQDEIDLGTQQLNGIQEQKREESTIEKLLLAGAQKIATNILKDNPKLLKSGLGLSDDQIADIWKVDAPKQLAQHNDNSSFAAAEDVTDKYSHLTPDHKEALESLIPSLESLEYEHLRYIYTLLAQLQIDEKTIDLDLAAKAIAAIKPQN